MAVALRHYLCNPHLLETAIGTNLDRSVVENLVLLSDCVYHVLVSGKGKLSLQRFTNCTYFIDPVRMCKLVLIYIFYICVSKTRFVMTWL